MDLQTIVRETKQLSDNVLVVSLTNGFKIIYEKQYQNKFEIYEDDDSKVKERRKVGTRTTVTYSLFHPESDCLCEGNNATEIQTNKPTSFSRQAHSSIDDYLKRNACISKRTSDIKDFDFGGETAKDDPVQLFEEFTSPLEIKEFKYRDWEEFGQQTLAVFGSPVLILWDLISRLWDSISGQNGQKHDHNGAGAYAIFALPIMPLYLLKELVAPNEFLIRGNRSKKTKGVLYGENRGDDPAVVFCHDDNPKKFTRLEIIFPNGMTLTDHGLFNYPNQEYVMSQYNKAKFFFHPDGELSKRVYDLNDRKQEAENRWKKQEKIFRQFYQQLKEETNHETFLKSVGFLS